MGWDRRAWMLLDGCMYAASRTVRGSGLWFLSTLCFVSHIEYTSACAAGYAPTQSVFRGQNLFIPCVPAEKPTAAHHRQIRYTKQEARWRCVS